MTFLSELIKNIGRIYSKFLKVNLRVLSLIIFTFITASYNCIQTETINVKDITLYPVEKYQIKFPIDMYVTNQFSESDKSAIKNGINNWSKATNGRVKVNLIFDYVPEREFTRDNFEFFSKYTLWKFEHDDPHLLPLQLRYSFFDGACVGNFIVISNSDSTKDRLFEVFSHEFGHLWGGQHLKPEYKGILNLGANHGIITKYDLAQFEYIYGK